MEKEKTKKMCQVDNGAAGSAGALYGLGFIGAAVYYIQTANGFWDGFIGLLKALVWPGFVVYELMKFLNM